MELESSDRGVSNVVGIVLLVAITVGLAGIIFAVTSGVFSSVGEPVNAAVSADSGSITLLGTENADEIRIQDENGNQIGTLRNPGDTSHPQEPGTYTIVAIKDGKEQVVTQTTIDETMADQNYASQEAMYAVYAGDGGGNSYKINEEGSQEWESETEQVLDMAVGPQGYVYLADLNGVFKLDKGGDTVWSMTEHGWMRAIAVDADGRIYAADGDDNTVYKLSRNGGVMWSYSEATDRDITAVEVGEDGDSVYILNEESLHKVDISDGTNIWTVSSGFERNPEDIAVHPDGNVYVGDEWSNMYKVSSSGTMVWGPDELHSDASEITGVGVDDNGDIYVTDYSGIMYKAEDTGSGVNILWQYDSGQGLGYGISVDKDGYAHIYTGHSHGVHRVSPDGTEEWSYSTDGQTLAGDVHTGPVGTFPDQYSE